MRKEQLGEVVAKTTKMLANAGITVTQQGVQAFCAWDQNGKVQRINLPMMPDQPTEQFLNALQGFIDHECAHALHTNAVEGMNEEKRLASDAQSRALLGGFANVVEDVRIERVMAEQFPGAEANLNATREFVIDTKWRDPLKEALKEGDDRTIQSVGIVPFMRALGGQRVCREFCDELGLDKHFEPLMRAIPDLERRILQMRSTTDAVRLADDIMKACKLPPPPPPAPPPPPSPMPQPSDDTDQGENEDQQEPQQDQSQEGKPSDEQDDASEQEPSNKPSNKKPKECEDGDNERETDTAAEADDQPQEDDGTDDEHQQDGEEESAGSSDADDDPAEDDDNAGDGDPCGSSNDTDETDDQGSEDEAGQDGGSESEPSDSSSEPDQDAADGDSSRDDSDAEDDEQSDEQQEGGTLIATGCMDIDFEQIEDMDAALADAIKLSVKDGFDTRLMVDFTRDWDRIEVYDPAKHGKGVGANAKPDIELTEKRVASMTMTMQKELQRLIVARAQAFMTPGFRRGRINPAALHRAAAGDDRLFRKKQEAITNKVAISLLIDNSGSMHGSGEKSKINTAMTAAWAFAETLERLKIPCEVLGFTTCSLPEGLDHNAIGDEIRTMSTTTGVPIGHIRKSPSLIPIYKDFEEKFGPVQKGRMAHLMAKQSILNSNNDAIAIEYAGRRLMKRQETRKILFVFSDGLPADHVDEGVLNFTTKHNVQKLEKVGVEVLGIGIQSDAVKRFYKNNHVIKDVQELPGFVMGRLKSLLAPT